MTVRLHLHRIRVIGVLVDLPERLEVLVRDLRSAVRCPFCGFKITKVHETRRVEVKDVPRGRQSVTLIWLRRRFQCTNCGERHTETHPAIEGRMTARLARAVVTDARHLSITEIARRYGFAWHTVMTVVRVWSKRVGDRRRSRPCHVLLVDETSLRRRHRYVTVVSNADTGEVLGIVRHRDFRALSGFLASQGTGGAAGSRSWSPTGPRATRRPSTGIWVTPHTSATASTSCAGSPKASSRCAGGSSASASPARARRFRR